MSAKTRRRRYWIAVQAVAALSLLAVLFLWLRGERRGGLEQLTAGSAAGFNVLVLTLDTTRADRLGCYGHSAAQTPVLDGLAAEGVRFDDAVTVVPVTLPSHATIFTGLDPPHHGVRNNGEFRLDSEHETLAEVLREKGYETAAFVSAFVLDARFGLDQGFDLYDDHVDFPPPAPFGALISPIHERSGGKTTDAAIRWLARRDRKRPFFCWVHYFDPHYPYTPPSPFAGRFRGRPYDGEIAYMDAQIGRLLQALITDGTRDNTLIIVVGDHGEGLGDHDETSHAQLIYDSTMRVPLLIACRGLFRGPFVVDDVVVSTADIFPTVLDLLGVENKMPCDGKSLIAAEVESDRMIYLETLASYFDNGWSPLYGLRRHNDKYILAPRPEYYNLRSDYDELSNLYDKVTGAALAARDMLVSELSARLGEQLPLDGIVATTRPLEPEAIRKLESLGYVGRIADADAEQALPDPKDMMPVAQGIDRADRMAGAGRLDEALAVLQEAASLAPRDPKVLLAMGNVHLQLGHNQEAEAAFRSAVANTSNPRMPIVAAQLFLEARLPAKALEFLMPLRQSHPDNVDALVNMGIAHIRLGQLEQAHAVLLHAERLDETRFETHINLTACLRRLGRPAEALQYADRAVALAPELAQTHHARGLALMQLGENEEALRSLTTAVSLDAGNPRIVQDVANVCARLGRYLEAQTHFETLATLLPTRWEPQLGLARVNLNLGKLDEAEAALHAGLRLAPNQRRLLALAGQLSELRNQLTDDGG